MLELILPNGHRACELESGADEVGSQFTMFQIVFNEISASEISQLPTLEQLGLLAEFKVTPEDLEDVDGERFGQVSRKSQKLFRYRAGDHRIYFEVRDGSVHVHRVLSANTFQDFLFRGGLPVNEDEAVGKSPHFWELIEEGRQTRSSG